MVHLGNENLENCGKLSVLFAAESFTLHCARISPHGGDVILFIVQWN